MKNNKKRSPMMKIVSAAAMLAVSASMLGTSTYAWFTMNNTVTVDGMKLKATASDGLLITDTTDYSRVWETSKNINMTSAVALSPTNTKDGSVWVYAKSDHYDDEDSEQAADNYTQLTLGYEAPSSNGANWLSTGEGVGSSGNVNYVLFKNFYVKGSGDVAWSKDLTVESVTATLSTTNSADGADNIYKSLRVLIVVGSQSFIYAPVNGYDNTIKFKNTDDLTLKASNAQSIFTGVNSIPVGNTDGINVKMYMYFEGEDDACKTSNVSGISLNDATISASFGTADNTEP